MQDPRPRLTALALLLSAAASSGRAQSPAAPAAAPAVPASPLVAAMRQELTRSMDSLKVLPTPLYYLSYEITEMRSASVRGTLGTVTSVGDERRRVLDVDLRVGSPDFDNTHAVRGGFPFDFFGRFSVTDVPLEDDPGAVRRILWYQTDRAYKRAVEQYARARTSAQLRVTPDDTSPDFSAEPSARYAEAPVELRLDRAAWERKVRAYTAPFTRHADIYDAEASLSAEGEARWFVNSEGSALQTSSAYYRLIISAYTRAADGMILPRYESFVASTPDGLPDDSAVARVVEKMIADLHALKRAPVVEAATAPAILSGRASGVLFHEVFGHRIEGHRLKDEDEGQTFKGMVGERILPADFSVYFDPTRRRLGGVELAGHYLYDNQGVRARRVNVVENGVFRSFLMSRSPIAGFAHSNGHGRSQPGMRAVARQSNLVVATSKPVSRAELKRRLLAEVKRQGKPFGLIFDDIEGGFTLTTRYEPNAFEVIPIMVYRVFPDGREELVRGVDLVGTPLTVFSKVLAADDDVRVFNGVCGAESGAVPVSASSPGILISQIEVQRKEKGQDRPPVLPPPVAAAAAAPPGDSADALGRAMRDELARSMRDLKLAQFERPYFIAYRVHETRWLDASASHGSLTGTQEYRTRTLSVELRVGDYKFDNTNFIGGGGGGSVVVFGRGRGSFRGGGGGEIPLDDDYLAIRRQIWLATDAAYKEAVEALSAKRAAILNRAQTDTLADFTRESPTRTTDEERAAPPDRSAAEALARELSALPELTGLDASEVRVSAAVTRMRYLNSEGTSLTTERPRLTLSANASTQAADGMPLARSVALHARSLEALPARDRLAQRLRALGRQLDSLRTAPRLDRYNGPVLLSADAAAVLFRQTFAPALVAERRMRGPAELEEMMSRVMGGGASFADKLGGRVLPEFLDVVDDPTLATFGDEPLLGGYKVDDEGVPGRRKVLVDGGILKMLLTSRTPVEGLPPHSTGNSRGGGTAPSNLFVTAEGAVSEAELESRLIALVTKRGLPFGVMVRALGPGGIGGEEDGPMAMMAAMAGLGGAGGGLIAYRVYPDGRKELVRAARLARVTAESFKDIVAASNAPAVLDAGGGDFSMAGSFFGAFFGGSSSAMVSYVVPSLLFDDMALAKSSGELPKPPILSRPEQGLRE